MADKIIPTTYTYKYALKELDNINNVIPFPMIIRPISSNFYILDTKPVEILYGITRNCLKGSKYIIPALERLKKTIPIRF